MQDDYYITELENRIARLISAIRTQYEKLKEQSSNIESLYHFNTEVDDLANSVERILFYKKQLATVKATDSELAHRLTPLSDEEISELRHQKLLSNKEIVETQIKFVDKAIEEAKKEEFLQRLVNRLEMERFRLTSEVMKIQSELRIYEGTPDLTDGEIDIYLNKNEDQLAFQGAIYIHGTAIEVGVIDYRGPENNKWLGDIGYTINQKYQGHNYAYKALNLIAPVILSSGIDKTIITTYTSNIPSRKTIEKFGGTIKDTHLGDVLVYECDLKKILEDKLQTSIKK